MGELLSDSRRALFALALMFGLAAIAVTPLRAAQGNAFRVVPLVSDQPGVAPNTDPNLVNAWGLTSGPTTPWWVADNGTDKSTLYRGSDGQPQALVVDVHNAPTGTVFNPTTGFALPSRSRPAGRRGSCSTRRRARFSVGTRPRGRPRSWSRT